jgi:hypothetical protein
MFARIFLVVVTYGVAGLRRVTIPDMGDEKLF